MSKKNNKIILNQTILLIIQILTEQVTIFLFSPLFKPVGASTVVACNLNEQGLANVWPMPPINK